MGGRGGMDEEVGRECAGGRDEDVIKRRWESGVCDGRGWAYIMGR